jgi:hypothetical protein
MLQADIINVQPTIKPISNEIVPSVNLSNGQSGVIAKTQTIPISPTSSIPNDQFQVERARDLDIISRLFGGKEEWEGRETDFEDKSSEGGFEAGDKDDESVERVYLPESKALSDTEKSDRSSEASVHHVEPPPSTTTRLKDLFAGQPLPGTSID